MLTSSAVAAGYNIELLRKVRLTNQYDGDFFRDRVMFTIHNQSGKVIAFAGRTLQKNSKTAKYINSPESVIGLTIMQEEFLEQSIVLAKLMQDKFANKLKRTDRKVKQAGFIVLHQTFMPSVLVETGFLTNEQDRKYLESDSGRAEVSLSLFKAIKEHKESLRKLD